VVIVTGGAAISPFTTPDAACQSGYAAGSTDSYLRRYLLRRGYRVFTSPAMLGRGRVAEQPGAGGPFGRCPAALPAYMTVNSAGDIELAGVHLANFVQHLRDAYGIESVDFVAHSMGGLYSRAAIAYLREIEAPIHVNTLTTLGTPWDGAIFANPTDPNDPTTSCDGFPICLALLDTFAVAAPVVIVEDSAINIASMNRYYAGALRGIPVTLIAGNRFTKDGGRASVWPNDGIVQVDSAFAAASDRTIEHRRCRLFAGGTHSLYISKEAGLGFRTAITWTPQVGSWVTDAIAAGASALTRPNRIGCPAGS
ncbi:MAG: lipase family alpha/beta hydrolase, partial [Gaiellales bacterium]